MSMKISNQDALNAIDLVKEICTKVGPGLPGSSQERDRAEIIKNEMESHLGAETVEVEEFILAPDAFLSPFPSVIFIILAVVLNTSTALLAEGWFWITAIAALVCSILPFALFIFEFILGFEVTDGLFPQKSSLNVIGRLRRPGTKKVTRLLILSAHHDSALENTWLRFLGYGFFFLSATYLIGLVCMPVINSIQLAGVILGNSRLLHAGTLCWALLFYPVLPSVLFLVFLTRGRQSGGNVPGAVDNLSGCSLVVTMCKYLVENPSTIPENTEIRFITFGSEEAGLRGSQRYVERHLDELKSLDARLLNYEMVVHPEIIILTSEMNGVVKNAPEMVDSLVAAAERAAVPYKLRPAYLGTSNDAGPFSRVGIKATTLNPIKSPQQLIAYYHQERDTPEALTIEPMLNVLKLSIEWIRNRGD